MIINIERYETLYCIYIFLDIIAQPLYDKSFCLLKPASFLQLNANSHFDLPPSSQQPMNRTKSINDSTRMHVRIHLKRSFIVTLQIGFPGSC